MRGLRGFGCGGMGGGGTRGGGGWVGRGEGDQVPVPGASLGVVRAAESFFYVFGKSPRTRLVSHAPPDTGRGSSPDTKRPKIVQAQNTLPAHHREIVPIQADGRFLQMKLIRRVSGQGETGDPGQAVFSP